MHKPKSALFPGPALFAALIVLASAATAWRYQEPEPSPASEPGFSALEAVAVLERILPTDRPHPLGSPENDRVRERLLREIRLAGGQPEVQEAFVCSPLGACGLVRNVVALLPGESDTAVLLSAHYDSAPSGPGAADDGASVAILVELLRDRASRPRPKPLIFLWNEGEEQGLLGSLAFMREHPLAAQVGAAVNLEARGSEGISQIFQSTADSEWMVRGFAAQARRPFTSSVSDVVLGLMPNYNDLAVFDSYGVPGVAFAFAEGEARYHSATDTVANLSLGSLQSQGDNADAMLRVLEAADLQHPQEGRAVFFDVLGLAFVSWPVQRSIPLALALLASLPCLGAALRRRDRGLRLAAVAAALAVPLATLGGAAALGLLADALPGDSSAHPALALAGLAAAVLAWGVAVARLADRWLSEGEQWAAWSLLLAAGALALAVVLPGTCYLLLLPTLCSVLGGAVALRSGRFVTASALPFACMLALFLPLIYGLHVALGFSAAVLLAVCAALAFAHGSVLLRELPAAGPAAGALGLAVLLTAQVLPPPETQPPARAELVYALSPDGTATWHVGVDGGVASELPGVDSPSPDWMGLPRLALPAEPQEQPGPVLDRARLVLAEDGWLLRGRLRSRRGAERATLGVPAEAELRSASIGGAVVPRSVSRWAGPGDSIPIEVFGDLAQGVDVELLFGAERPPPVTLVDRATALPPGSEELLASLGRRTVPGWQGSYSVSWTSFDPMAARQPSAARGGGPPPQITTRSAGPLPALGESSPSAASRPEAFWWGIASSPYQTEEPGTLPGQPDFFETDWDLFAQAGRVSEGRGQGTLSWSRFERDVEALQELGVSHYRFGVEWARVEPRPGEYNEVALARYASMARQLRAAGIEPVLCLWHFTFPSWATDLADGSRHGWLSPAARERWPGYVEAVASVLGPEITWWAPQNEPNAQAMAGYFLGIWPPGITHDLKAVQDQTDAAAEAWLEAAAILRRADPDARLITVQNIISWQRAPWDFPGLLLRIGEDYNFRHLDAVAASADWVGFNYYYRREATIFPAVEQLHPRGLHAAIEELSRYGKPLVVMENGTGSDDDSHRGAFIRAHVRQVELARKEGHDVRGYFVWSLVDNFEWALGYDSHYGLHSYDRRRGLLLPKGSARLFRELIEGG